MITLREINKERVKPIPQLKQIDKDNIKGSSLFDEIYANIFLLAKKKSGKTTVIYNILKKCIDKDTRIIIFASTVHKDESYAQIIKLLKKNKNPYELYTSLVNPVDKTNHLRDILEELQIIAEEEKKKQEEEEQKKNEPKKKLKYISFDDSDNEDDERKKKKRKKKKMAPEIIFIFDDLSTELRSPHIAGFLKQNRHFFSKVILSSQYLHDLQPESIKQLDYLCAFKGLTDGKLEKVYALMDLSIDYKPFEKLYKHATDIKYCFLYIDIVNQKFRNCFNKEYTIN